MCVLNLIFQGAIASAEACAKNFDSSFIFKLGLFSFLLFTFVFYRLLRKENKWGKYAALLLLPNEVLFDTFKFLDRRQLTKLERVCPRFHRIISDHIGETPFLRLDLEFGFNSRYYF